MKLIQCLTNKLFHVKFHVRNLSALNLQKKQLAHSYNYLALAYYCKSKALSSEKKMSDYIYPNNTPIIQLECQEAFDKLTEKEKHYAHYLSKASWLGGLIDLLQTSPESPLIFILIRKLFQYETPSDLKLNALNRCAFTPEDVQAFFVYVCGVLSNVGNYKGFGDTKFIPNLKKENFEKLVLASDYAKNNHQEAQSLLFRCIDSIYSLREKECCLGFPSKGTTTYLSKNINEEDLEAVKKFLKTKNIEAFNSRLFKTREKGKCVYEIRLASVLGTDSAEERDLLGTNSVNGHNFVITRGDYSKLLKLVNEQLLLAKEYAANEVEEKMIENYIRSFHTGSIEAHKDGSRFWIKDKSPIVETYMGFIETYRDPAGMRGEFEGFVAIVNKTMSAKFAELVKSAETLIPLLPWPKAFEMDTFLQPDFTSLDVLTYACSSVPCGICIPNYNEIRQKEGFKNVSLGNTIHAKTSGAPNFVSKTDQDLLMKYRNNAMEIDVGLHELLGHGSGKLFSKKSDGTFNFDIENVVDFVSNEKISTWYEEGETYDSVFGSLGSSYEECRAECVALYLSDCSSVLSIFGYEGDEALDITYTIWLDMILKGLEGLEMYDPKTDTWLQAHSQARFAILQVVLESGEDFVKIEKTTGEDGKPDLLLTVDRSKIINVGKPAIGKFLGKLQLYRCTANIKSAKEMYDKCSLVISEDKHPFLDYREVVMDRKKPRRMFVQANTVLEDGAVKLRTYTSDTEGLVESWIDRFQDANIETILEELWEKDQGLFK
ncbi:dipeptidyl peptidase 3 [Trichonephila inaurata madagascariensis]|uniref:Dipeptidyl peptidase 3 n=1 Tax=Trichonephila inaurata madagascariensis TaxID=2747483 RepID=A0A8X6X994_9ARAC|nr:dipeptidyl peptidase 3 [Trichonephila inaurata madagascariensis]